VRLPHRRRPTRELVPLAAIAADALCLRDGGLRAILECPTLAFGIKGEAEQRAIVDGWAALLNSLAHPLQIVIRTRALDTRALPPLSAPSDERRAPFSASYARLLGELASERRIVDRRFYVVVPWDDAPRHRGSNAAEGLAALEQRVRWIEGSLRRLDLQPRRLPDPELADLLRRSLDPVALEQPLAPGASVLDAADLVAPAGFLEQAAWVAVSERFARTVALTRYPARLEPGWLGDLQAFDGDLDVALHLRPSAGPAVMAFLERRVAELSSTVRLMEQSGGRGDPYRRAALQDALELQDRVAQGTERLFDVGLYFTLWARSPGELDAATLRLEALLGTRIMQTHRLLFQMRGGLLSSLPLGIEPVAVRRVLSTGALSASFPFTGTDLAARAGLLYGVNAATRSPVFLDRFALENHNAVVFATSGAGKSYLVKVELARALLAGHRALVIDPEGEYAPLLTQLGVALVALRPGAPMGLDPFAVADASPGALTSRIAVLETLVALLVGGFAPGERAAIASALSFIYARAGFADGRATTALRAPNLADLRACLVGTATLEDLARRLSPYVSGASGWLFSRDENTSPPGTTNGLGVVYVLAGLPEEERAAAMFLVLDAIWSSLADSSRPTLVVVDEAWWLMRHADTAAYLFRLVKTARKRRAGLTLVTQDVGDVLASPDGEAVIANAALQVLMKQAPQAMPRLAELFRLTRAEQSWLLGAARGEGLLVAQGKRVPFQVVATAEEARLIAGGRAT
jgi:hypothetical protein